MTSFLFAAGFYNVLAGSYSLNMPERFANIQTFDNRHADRFCKRSKRMQREYLQTLLRPTFHALTRQARRNLSNEDIEFVIAHGYPIHCAGALHIFLRRCDIPKDKLANDRFARLEGTVLVVNVQRATPVLITVYRNRKSLKQIRSKAKYDVRHRRSAHPH